MHKFIKYLLLFCIIPLPVLLLLGYVVDAGLQHSHHRKFSEWNDIFQGKINADLLVMGNSRAWAHFSPAILDSQLRLNSYNLGIDGAPFEMQYARFKMYLKFNTKPKYILQEVSFLGTLSKINNPPNLQQFLPYLSNKDMLDLYYKAYNNYSIADKYFPLYKYNNEFPLIIEGVSSFIGHGTKINGKYKGYEGKDVAWDSSFYNFTKTRTKDIEMLVDTGVLQLFKDYLLYCKQNNIKIILVYSPFYHPLKEYVKNYDYIYSLFKNTATDFLLPFLDYTNDSLCYSTKYFYNSSHLNEKGAEIFSNNLANDLKKIVQ